MRAIAQLVWFERYGHRIEAYHLPKGQAKREALEIDADGFQLLNPLEAPYTSPETRTPYGPDAAPCLARALRA